AIGTTTVVCNSTSGGHGTFQVTVADTTAPVLVVPRDFTFPIPSGSGAPVTFTVSATDTVDGSVAVNCSPASGSFFAAGITTVTCSATDAHHNTATDDFDVEVVIPPPPPFHPD